MFPAQKAACAARGLLSKVFAVTLWDVPLPVTASHKVCDLGFMHDAKWA